jgi:putative SOS response-associated peptidase YedK
MCSLYSQTKGQQAIRDLVRATRDTTGNLPPLLGIFRDGMAPVVAAAPDGERELTMMRWGMPSLPQFAGPPVTNIRNTTSPHWSRWLGPDNRCLAPVTSFCEWEDTNHEKPHLVCPG